MNETKTLYEDAYATEFTATVISCNPMEGSEEAAYQVILDQTLFFPEQGGQSPDLGTIDGIPVLDVQIKGGVISHKLPQPLPEGTVVSGKIDWEHRFNNMQQHSGEHIFSGLVHKLYGYNNVGFHLSDQIVTMDFDGKLTDEQVEDLETRVNHAIVENVPITITFPSKEELQNLDYRSKIEIEGQVRIVTVEGYDVCACCAPHVKRTGEIGQLKVMSRQNYKGGVRISILCGFRALEAEREKAKLVAALSDFFTCGQEQILDAVQKQRKELLNAKGRLNDALLAQMEAKAMAIPGEQKNVILFEREGDLNLYRKVLNALMESHDGVCGIFVGYEDKYSYILGSKGVDCKEIATLLREKLSAKGGGSSQMIQGSVEASESAITEVLAAYN